MHESPANGLLMDVRGHRLYSNGCEVKLARKPFLMLTYFIKNEGKVLSLPDILANVWPKSVVSTHSVKDYVADIRRALNDSATSPRYVETVRGAGYRYLGGITTTDETSEKQKTYGLPADITPFVGRERELAELAGLLSSQTCRVLSLVGPGGIGKTRLVQTLIRNTTLDFVVAFVSLRQVTTPELMLSTIASVLKIAMVEGENLLDQVTAKLAVDPTLLILDNVDKKIHATGMLSKLLESIPSLKLILTSRSATNLYGEWVFNISGLSLEKNKEHNCDACSLFLQTAKRVDHTFSVSEGEQAYISKICNILNGIPLAIEIAAPWTKSLSVEELHESLKIDDSLLENVQSISGYGDVSLRVLMQQHWDSLSDKEQTTLGVLSIFRGPCTEEALLSIAEISTDVVSTLLDKSMLVRLDTKSYEIHEVMREFAGDWLARHDNDNTYTTNFIQYYNKKVSQADDEILSAKQSYWIIYLDQEMQNLRKVLDIYLQGPQASNLNIEHGLHLVGDLAMYWFISNRWNEGKMWTEKLLQAGAEASPHSISRAELTLAGLCALGEDFDLANDCLKRCLASFQNGPTKQKARTHIAFGVLRRMQGRYTESIDHCKLSLEEYINKPDDGSSLVALGCIGQSYIGQKKYDNAIEAFKQSLLLGEKIGPTMNLPHALINLGRAYWASQNFTDSRITLESSLPIARQMKIRVYIAQALLNLGWLEVLQKQTNKTQELFCNAAEIFLQLGDKAGLVESIEGLSVVSCLNRDHATAVQFLAASEHLRDALGCPIPAECQNTIDSSKQTIFSTMEKTDITTHTLIGRSITPDLLVTKYAKAKIQ